MFKRPLCEMAIGFLLGILFLDTKSWYLFLPAILIIFMMAGSFIRQKKYVMGGVRVVFFSLMICLGFCRYRSLMQMQAEYEPMLVDDTSLTVQGTVAEKEYKNSQYVYYLDSCIAAFTTGNLSCDQIMFYSDANTYQIGETLIVNGKIKNWEPAYNEGNFDAKAYYRSQRIAFQLDDATVDAVYGKADKLRESLFQLRCRVLNVFVTYMGEEDSGVMATMTLGDKSALMDEIKQLYQTAGISHILAISGLHISVIGMSLYRFLRKIRLNFLQAGIASGVLMVLYGMMTGFGTSTKRAILMFLLMLLAQWIGRSYDMLSALGMAAIVILWENPFLIHYAGFLLSFAAVLGVAVIGNLVGAIGKTEAPKNCKTEETGRIEAPKNLKKEETRRIEAPKNRKKEKTGRIKVSENFKKKKTGRIETSENFKKEWIGKGNRKILQKLNDELINKKNTLRGNLQEKLWNIKESLWFSYSIQLATLPIVAYFYYEIPVYTMLVNLVILPFMSALLFCGIAGGLLGLYFPFGAKICFVPCHFILYVCQKICALCDQFPHAMYITGKPSIIKMTIYYIVIIFLVILLKKLKKRKCFGMLSLLALVVLFWRSEKGFELCMLDVGQGDGCYLQTEDGYHIFVDGGSSDIRSVGKYRILPFLKAKGVQNIDYWFVSHTDADHISGLEEILEEQYPIDYLIFAKGVAEDETLEELLRLAEENQTQVLYMSKGDILHLGEAEIECVFPMDGSKSEDKNEQSLVFYYNENGISGIFTGDIGSETEKELLSMDVTRDVTFYKVAHHGSNNSNTEDFLEELSPELALISCGRENSYGHPGKDAVERIEEAGCEIFCTMESGQITIKGAKNGNLASVEACGWLQSD